MTTAILDRGLVVDDGRLQYAWFKVQAEQGIRYHAVALRELAAIPLNLRDDPDVLGKQWAAVRGLYNARVNFAYAAAGIFAPEHIGIVQYYGATADASNHSDAARDALHQVAAVEAALANYPQSRLVAPTLRWVEWYLNFVADHNNRFLAILGYPDPRQGRRGLGRDGIQPDQNDDDLAAEQNELLFRGLAKLREDFVFQVTAERIAQERLTTALTRVAEQASVAASRQRGSLSVGMSLGIPIMAALSQGLGGGHSAAQSQAHSQADGVSEGWGVSHTDSQSHTTSHAVSVGGAETWGESHSTSTGVSHGVSAGHTDSQGTSHTDSQGTAHTESQSASHTSSVSASHGSSTSVSDGVSSGTSSGHSSGDTTSSGVSQSAGHTASTGDTVSGSFSNSTSASEGDSSGHSDSSNWGHSQSLTQSAGVNAGAAAIVSGGVQQGWSGTDSGSWGGGASDSVGHSTNTGFGTASTTGSAHSMGSADSTGQATSQGLAHSESAATGASSGISHAVTHSTSDAVTVGSSDTVTRGSADTVSRGTADSTSKGTADSKGTSDTVTTTESYGTSHAISKTWGETWGESNTVGSADGKSASWGRSHQTGDTAGEATGRGGQASFSGGFSAGLAPSLSVSQSYQTEDDVAIRLTEILRGLEGVVNQASLEGGFMTSACLIAAGERGAAAAAALASQAFHGPNVPTPVLTLTPDPLDEIALREATLAFLPAPDRPDPGDPFAGLLWRRYSTLLTAGQVAAYTAPGLFEEGTAQVVTEQLPKGLGFYPELPGDIVLGHQYSPETGDLTTAPLRLDRPRMFHTLFAADTGYGKSVAAIRLVYETVLRWQMPTVVLDWGAGWRQLLNAPGLQGRVNIVQLWPHAVRPLRWNPLQIGRNIPPETQWRTFADIFGSIARLGVKRQKQELLEALREVYLDAGVLIDDPDVRGDPELGRVRPAEAALIEAQAGLALGDLTHPQRQALAVERSRTVGLQHLYDQIKNKLHNVPPRDTMLTGVLEGILFRLNALVQGAAALQFAPGFDTVPMEDLVRDWGVTIIEGGSFLDEFGKAFLLGWAGWHLYTDAVARRVHTGATTVWAQIVFEEANKIFGGIPDGGSGEDGGGGAAFTAQQFGNMFRDSRKYGIWLHVIAQSPSLVPPDIISSCNNLFAGFLKNPKDKDVILSALAKSEKGFTDETWRRFLSDLPTGQFIARLGYAADRYQLRPMLVRPLLLNAPEPDDAAIAAALGVIRL